MCGADYPTTDFFTGGTGRLAGKVILHTVDDDGSANDILQTQSSSIKAHPGVTVTAKQWRHIPGMVWVWYFGRIVMFTCLLNGGVQSPVSCMCIPKNEEDCTSDVAIWFIKNWSEISIYHMERGKL